MMSKFQSVILMSMVFIIASQTSDMKLFSAFYGFVAVGYSIAALVYLYLDNRNG